MKTILKFCSEARCTRKWDSGGDMIILLFNEFSGSHGVKGKTGYPKMLTNILFVCLKEL